MGIGSTGLQSNTVCMFMTSARISTILKLSFLYRIGARFALKQYSQYARTNSYVWGQKAN